MGPETGTLPSWVGSANAQHTGNRFLDSTAATAEFCANSPTAAWRDEDLVEECLRGNEHAWAAVIEKYKNLVYSAPLKYRMSPQDAADIFQEVWVDLYAELGNLRKPGALGGWLVSVAYHKCFQWKRRKDREGVLQPMASGAEPPGREMPFPDWKEQAEREQILRRCVDSLPDRCRQMVQMLFFQNPAVPYALVARQLGLAQGSIGFIRGRCLEKLRLSLEREGF
jgi:RNA polymerase sigma factor (sigma-70 family)